MAQRDGRRRALRVLIDVARRAAAMLLLGLSSGVAFLWITRNAVGIEIENPLAIMWCIAWWIGFCYATWNAFDSFCDVQLRRSRSILVKVVALRLLRADALSAIACLCMAWTGYSAVFRLGEPALRATLLLFAAFALMLNQIMNRVDRERLLLLDEDAPSGEAP